jgi:hypothetical protein
VLGFFAGHADLANALDLVVGMGERGMSSENKQKQA